MEQSYWRKCGTCKKEIEWGQIYQKCSVSSCRKYAYCSVDCWSVHDSVMGHISAYAEEEKAPIGPDCSKPRRRIVMAPLNSESRIIPAGEFEIEVLIVASKLKKYVKDKHGLSTSGNVMDRLSELVRDLVDDAVIRARQEGRKTLMDRDF